MKNLNKIATCSYCSSRTVLRLSGQVRHELACTNCGAPLSEMKSLRLDRGPNVKRRSRNYPVNSYRNRKRIKHRVKRDWNFWDELWDDIEDFFDDAFDALEDLFD